MKYFLLDTDPAYMDSLDIINWYGKIDVRNIRYDKAHLLPSRQLLYMRGYEKAVFTDIVSKPFFLVSEMVKDVIRMYQPETIFKEIILLDAENEKTQRYFLPIFRELNCLSEKSTLNSERSVIRKAILSKRKLKDWPVFRIGDVNSAYITARLDFVESILKRKAAGVRLTPLEVEDEGEPEPAAVDDWLRWWQE